MFHLIVNATNQYLKDLYNQYGLNFDVVASTDLDDLKQYTNNFNYRSIYRNDKEVRMLSDLQKRFSNTKDYAVLLYNYEAPKRVQDKFNNINLKAYFNETKDHSIYKLKENELKALDGNTQEFLRGLKVNSSMQNNLFVVRDVKVITMTLNYKLICPNQEFIDNFTMLYLTDLQRNLAIPVTIDFGSYVGSHTIDIDTQFEDIESWGLIDTSRAGDLKQVGFTLTITSPIFSNFTDLVSGLREIRVSLGI